MQLIIILLLSIVSLTVVSCSKHEEATANAVYDIDLTKLDADSLPLSEFADSVIYIDPETTADSRIGRIKDMAMVDSSIVLIDNASNEVMLFGSDGRYVGKIGSRGQGPGEFIKPNAIDADDKNIYVYDHVKGEILKYDYQGDYVSSDKTDFADDFKHLSFKDRDAYLISRYNTDKNNAGVYLITEDGSRKSKLLGSRYGIAINHPYDILKDGKRIVVFSNDFENCIYTLKGDSLVCETKLNVTPLPTSDEIEKWEAPDILNHYVRTGFFVNGKWIFLNYSGPEGGRIVIIDKMNKTVRVTKNIYNDLDSTHFIFWPRTAANGNPLIETDGKDEESNPRLVIPCLKK